MVSGLKVGDRVTVSARKALGDEHVKRRFPTTWEAKVLDGIVTNACRHIGDPHEIKVCIECMAHRNGYSSVHMVVCHRWECHYCSHRRLGTLSVCFWLASQ